MCLMAAKGQVDGYKRTLHVPGGYQSGAKDQEEQQQSSHLAC